MRNSTSPLKRHNLIEESSPSTVSLLFPSSWIAPRNPHAAKVQDAAAIWFRELGVIHDVETAARFDAMAIADYGGLPFPLADYAGVEAATRFLSLWLFYDDLIEGAGERSEALVTACLRGELAVCPDGPPCLRGWWQLGKTLRARMSRAWCERLSQRFADWLATLSAESQLAARCHRQETPSATEYLAVRTINIGVFPTLPFIELTTGVELSAALLTHPAFATIELLAAGLITIANDLYAFSKDRAQCWPNLVSSLAANVEHELPLRDAFLRAGTLHRTWLAELLCAEEELLAEIPDETSVRRWLRGVHHIIAGLTRWHTCAARYRSVHTLPDGNVVELAIWPH